MEISVRRVKDVFFAVNERSFIPDPTKIIKIELGQSFGINTDVDLANFTLRIYCHYEETPQDILCDIQIENVFQITEMKSLPTKGHLVIFPKNIIISIVSMSLSHGRALLLKNTAGTVFQDVILPVTNAHEVAKHFFPYLFPDENELMPTQQEQSIVSNEVSAPKQKKNKKSGKK